MHKCSLCQGSVRVSEYKKYSILTTEPNDLVMSFNDKVYICETCHKHLLKGATPCQAVCNKIALSSILNELQDLRCLEKQLISHKILFEKLQ